ncbi:hypothetical protein Pan44_11790 [Caulifigura coniformis]|uniref:Uncharacterized protein n=1 Tax=Caulifigura coniformis TaxID=2527983 RepID=A0A517SAK9_9PLAN|nr:hypothetical protein [Caulifigura coniformis]QDT53164.1 hypothetical protein Pan44_11790 [Caulifigura coniformis]
MPGDNEHESCLMLGYEPSQVHSEISLLDYSRCALETDVTPTEFLKRHNPMFEDLDALLGPFSTRIATFDSQRSYILLINNSMSAFDQSRFSWQGVLHMATIPSPSDKLSRVINSTMLASVDLGTPEPLSAKDLEEFLTAATVRRSGYTAR